MRRGILKRVISDFYRRGGGWTSVTSEERVLLGRFALVAQRSIVVKLYRERSVGRSVCLSVGLSSALWKNGRSDPDTV